MHAIRPDWARLRARRPLGNFMVSDLIQQSELVPLLTEHRDPELTIN